ncbi:ABC transporter permease [Paludibaculum fermentans]|uniref:ABC transporter permease n=1 Tax=Paludibaculum fermentans TaxID=1473598 RepID=A0A7S7NR37_PALFE|nr:ABC transporter permease [Paludibaculum fermentans]QOY88170.1 ABC transporter permease [Paludibaculum fermentans]
MRSSRWVIGFAGLLFIWWVGAEWVSKARQHDLPKTTITRLYPRPAQVAAAALELPFSDVLHNITVSSFRVLAGFLLAAVVAVPLGFIFGRLRTVAGAFEPVNDFIRYLPVAGFSTLAIFLLGTGDASAVLVVFLGTAFHLVVANTDAVRRVPTVYFDLGRTKGLSRSQLIRRILIPAAAPAIWDNLRISVGWAWSYVTLAEIMGSEGGLGHAIEVSRRYIRTDQVLVWITIVGLLGVLSDVVMRFAGHRMFGWAYALSAIDQKARRT